MNSPNRVRMTKLTYIDIECNAIGKCRYVLYECIEKDYEENRGRCLPLFIEHGRSFLLTYEKEIVYCFFRFYLNKFFESQRLGLFVFNCKFVNKNFHFI